jgi:hypothetical protein
MMDYSVTKAALQNTIWQSEVPSYSMLILIILAKSYNSQIYSVRNQLRDAFFPSKKKKEKKVYLETETHLFSHVLTIRNISVGCCLGSEKFYACMLVVSPWNILKFSLPAVTMVSNRLSLLSGAHLNIVSCLRIVFPILIFQVISVPILCYFYRGK